MAKHDQIYEDFEPNVDWIQNGEHDTLLVYLPGFSREQIKVQVTSARKLRVMGERPLKDRKTSRFHKEIQIPSEYDMHQISANFEHGVLRIKHPRTSKAKEQQANAKASAETARPQEPTTLQNQKDARIKEKSTEDKNSQSPNQEGKDAEASKKLGQHVPKAEKTDKEATATESGKSKFDYHKQVFERLATETKRRIKSPYCIVATTALLSLGLGIYVKYALMSPDESEN